jgi:hypothetical protein
VRVVMMMAVMAMSQHRPLKNNAAFVVRQRSISKYAGYYFDPAHLNFA